MQKKNFNTNKGKLFNVPHHVAAIQADRPNRIYLGNGAGVFASIDAGMTWRRLIRNPTPVPVVDLVCHAGNKTLTAAIFGRSKRRILLWGGRYE